MARSVLGVIAGYLAMVLLVFLTFSGAYLLMGAEGAFRPASYEVSGLWLATSFVLSLLAATAGGYVCAAVSRRDVAPVVMAGVVLVFGLMAAGQSMRAGGESPARTGDVPNLAAAQQARTPPWVALLNPLVGAAGVLAGARLRDDGHDPAAGAAA
ncbi:MAG TPA: hypothetical protein VEY09_00655 [Pyrinomonadaceae bacterium]|nr:hypothetical protein [Pyrinomonadaceae bacterium]